MRFLGIGNYNELGAMYLHLLARGHEVRVHVADPGNHDVLAGLVPRVDDWQAELPWIKAAGEEGFILFESASMGPLQDRLRQRGYQVIGGGSYGDRLEGDRDFGQAAMRAAQMQTAASHEFGDFAQAIDFVRDTRRRYVYKLNGAGFASMRNYVGQLDDGRDLIAQLKMQQRGWRFPEPPSFILMDYLEGVEVGVGAYFNGQDFLRPACIDWEHKRFFPGDLGELTGEMGTLVSYRSAERLFDLTLGRMVAPLRAAGYCGYININTIVNDQGVWPLEFTCRFGYPGFAILDALHEDGWDVIFMKMLRRERHFKTRAGFAVGVVLTVPPFPYSVGYEGLSRGLPICFRDGISEEERRGLRYGEVALDGDQLVTSGSLGYTMVATGQGATVELAQQWAYELAGKVVVPNLRYRRDIGERFVLRDQQVLSRLGYLGPAGQRQDVALLMRDAG